MKTKNKGTCINCPYYDMLDGHESTATCHHSSQTDSNGNDIEVSSDWWCEHHPLRRRHIIAEQAMAAFVATGRCESADNVAINAYKCADAMIAEAEERLTEEE